MMSTLFFHQYIATWIYTMSYWTLMPYLPSYGMNKSKNYK